MIPEQYRKLNKEFDQRPLRKILKLPCGHGNIEITRPQDQYITCPKCFHKFLLIWSKIAKYKIEGEL